MNYSANSKTPEIGKLDLTTIEGRIKYLRDEKEWTQEMLAEKLNVAQSLVAKVESGKRNLTTEEAVRLAELYETSTDFILRGIEPDNLNACIKTGLTNDVVNALSDAPASDKPYGAEHAHAMSQQATTMSYRAIINLLLSNEHGQKAIRLLSSFFFGQLDSRSQVELTAYVTPWEMPDGGTYLETAMLTDELQRGILLSLASNELRKIRDMLTGNDAEAMAYTYTKPSKETDIKERQAAYDARNPHKSK